MQAQAQLAAVDQDGLIQLGSNHPFVVKNYVMDISHLRLGSPAAASDFFEKYEGEGFVLTFDMGNQEAKLEFDLDEMSQYTGRLIPVADMNQKLRDVHRLKR